jgi:flagellar FliL protein
MGAKGKKQDQNQDEADSAPEEKAPEKGGKSKLLILIGAAVLLLCGSGAGLYFTGMLDSVLGSESEIAGSADADSSEAEVTSVFYELPDIVVSLNTGQRKSRFLKVRVNLELTSSDDTPRIEKLMPRIMDYFQVYLRELSVEDVNGSAGTFRLREELLKRVNAALAPTRVNDVLFIELLIQ